MKNWEINYHNLAKDEVKALPTKLLARYFALADRMKVNGPNLGYPHTSKLRDDLYEIRVSAQEGIARAIYFSMKDNQIWILRCFVKKTQKTPKNELEIASIRQKELNNE